MTHACLLSAEQDNAQVVGFIHANQWSLFPSLRFPRKTFLSNQGSRGSLQALQIKTPQSKNNAVNGPLRPKYFTSNCKFWCVKTVRMVLSDGTEEIYTCKPQNPKDPQKCKNDRHGLQPSDSIVLCCISMWVILSVS